jgi:hypothetical protein
VAAVFLSAGLNPTKKAFAPTTVPPSISPTLDKASRLFIVDILRNQ